MIQSFGFLYIPDRNCITYRTFKGLYSHIFIYIFIYSSVTFADVSFYLVMDCAIVPLTTTHYPADEKRCKFFIFYFIHHFFYFTSAPRGWTRFVHVSFLKKNHFTKLPIIATQLRFEHKISIGMTWRMQANRDDKGKCMVL